ncbi:hypothetical protein [Pontibacter ramchanderi]|uniref:DUF8192 domain-containing protein n=1 Tax=Pontibacter ramchanderi TaxID=1179743 RepID=A0A2N3U806_9BACT|nr:hypothetical protein [Pontibacter ramchanderi]PKV62889.1 hypothetical protein BD749_2719 [Pontibacter ramchanderi]
MKILLTALFSIFLTAQAYSQDMPGVDNNPVLNLQESALLDSLFHKDRGAFSFTNKKVGFFAGHSVTDIQTKKDFFGVYILPYLAKNEKPLISYRKLDKNQKAKSGGYDVIVFMIPKVWTQKQLNKNLQTLANKEEKIK